MIKLKCNALSNNWHHINKEIFQCALNESIQKMISLGGKKMFYDSLRDFFSMQYTLPE